MPPAKNRAPPDEGRTEGSAVRDRHIAATSHVKKGKNGVLTSTNNLSAKEPAPPNADPGAVAAPGAGMAWNNASLELLNSYRIAHEIPTPAAFTGPLHQALLTNPGIGRQSPTMARKREKRRVSKEQLALAVRKNFNGAAVSEIDVVVELIYKVRNQGKSFRLRSYPGATKK